MYTSIFLQFIDFATEDPTVQFVSSVKDGASCEHSTSSQCMGCSLTFQRHRIDATIQ